MADVVDRATRSRMMSGIKGRNTRPELEVRQALHAAGFRYRLHAADLPGRPDIVLSRYRVVILVHGCFWHRHTGCRFTTTPSTRPDFWRSKFEANVLRDQRSRVALEELGWRIATVWECAVRRNSSDVARQLEDWIRSDSRSLVVE